MESSKILKKKLKSKKILCILSLLFLVIGVILYIVGNNYSKEQASENKESFHELLNKEYKQQLGKTAFVDNVNGVYYTYYEYTTKRKFIKNVENYYILYYELDNKNYNFIVKLVNKKLEDYLLKEKKINISDLSEDNTISINGYTEIIGNDVKKELIKIIKDDENIDEEYKNELINDFDDYFGLSLINLSRRYYSSVEVIGAFLIIISIIAIIISVYSNINTKKTLKKLKSKLTLDDIYNDLDSQNIKIYKKAKTILLDKYLLCYEDGLKIVYYSDIEEINVCELKVYGIKFPYIGIKLSNNKNIKIANCKPSKKLNNEHNEILAEISNKLNQKKES